ncbi:DUF3618 domain-containing protein [Catellatospora sp. KI3]|uniref:DUF3618 domain-containing protein n=1 Tax=Catellatospora sp. KI3 TaxID=3041620 RepID=UPI002482A8FA|nr:DUF3618 domain-containing protein [Catellatospora sp. KI3]MDI1462855.1 DUF3618 domain-containing protein [Catellatospora sp. KI3]
MDPTQDVTHLDAQAAAARAALGQTLAQLADRADVPARLKAKSAEVVHETWQTVNRPQTRMTLALAAGALAAFALVLLARRRR